MKIPWKGASEGQPPTEEQYQERFWRRRLDGIGLDVVTKEFLDIDFKRTQDMRSNHLDEITAVAQKQYKSLLMGLQAIGHRSLGDPSASFVILSRSGSRFVQQARCTYIIYYIIVKSLCHFKRGSLIQFGPCFRSKVIGGKIKKYFIKRFDVK
jgi:hypothetical protein